MTIPRPNLLASRPVPHLRNPQPASIDMATIAPPPKTTNLLRDLRPLPPPTPPRRARLQLLPHKPTIRLHGTATTHLTVSEAPASATKTAPPPRSSASPSLHTATASGTHNRQYPPSLPSILHIASIDTLTSKTPPAHRQPMRHPPICHRPLHLYVTPSQAPATSQLPSPAPSPSNCATHHLRQPRSRLHRQVSPTKPLHNPPLQLILPSYLRNIAVHHPSTATFDSTTKTTTPHRATVASVFDAFDGSASTRCPCVHLHLYPQAPHRTAPPSPASPLLPPATAPRPRPRSQAVHTTPCSHPEPHCASPSMHCSSIVAVTLTLCIQRLRGPHLQRRRPRPSASRIRTSPLPPALTCTTTTTAAVPLSTPTLQAPDHHTPRLPTARHFASRQLASYIQSPAPHTAIHPPPHPSTCTPSSGASPVPPMPVLSIGLLVHRQRLKPAPLHRRRTVPPITAPHRFQGRTFVVTAASTSPGRHASSRSRLHRKHHGDLLHPNNRRHDAPPLTATPQPNATLPSTFHSPRRLRLHTTVTSSDSTTSPSLLRPASTVSHSAACIDRSSSFPPLPRRLRCCYLPLALPPPPPVLRSQPRQGLS